ncbi:hypothetical protein MTP99_005395 [Tenebrio molitor]|nr:hypothetical protein MTP99_005395 [Tenebrio molitor]
MAMNECKNIFKWSQWNCPHSAFSKRYNHLPTREKAYTDAITAAGIIYSITRDCSQGIVKNCGCNSKTKETTNPTSNIFKRSPEKSFDLEKDWSWGGCSDNASFGENLVLKLLDDSEKGSDPQAFISRHNNKIGGEIIREKMLKICKCHGVSGSCTFQTCWMQMPSFSSIAKELKERYDNAILISFDNVEDAWTVGNSARQLSLAEDVLPNNLVFLEKSPNFCISANTTGLAGTKGRSCSRNSTNSTVEEKRSCRNLCRACGYKVRKQKKKIKNNCHCKFTWCCQVDCEDCVQYVQEYFCD